MRSPSANLQIRELGCIAEEQPMRSGLFNFRMAPLSNVLNRSSRFSVCILGLTSMLCLALSLPHCILAQTSIGTLIAVNQADADISIVDPEAAKEVARVSEGAVAGHEVAASLDGKVVYVSIYGDSSVGDPGTDGRELLAIDLATRKVVGRLDFGHGVRPHAS
jgi:hypothetical protein